MTVLLLTNLLNAAATDPVVNFALENKTDNSLIISLIAIFAVLIIFLLAVKWILNSISNHIKEHLDSTNRVMEQNFNTLKNTIIEAIRTLQDSNLRSMETLSGNTLKVLSHVIDLKKESGNFITDPKTSKHIFDAFMELQTYKDVETIVEAISNKTITRVDEAITYCLIKFKSTIDKDISVLSKIDFISGNLGNIVKDFVNSGGFADYINVCTNSILTEFWNEKDYDKIRQNAFSKLLLFRQDILKQSDLGLED